MKKASQKVAVVIPCYNEAASIGQVISKFPYQAIKDSGLELVVYVVDNNSTDNTSEVAKKAGAIVIHEPRKGKGNALRTGFRSIADDVDFVAMLDGDDTYSPEEILRVIEPLRSNFCSVVVGSRLAGHIQAAAMKPFNRLGNWLFTNIVRMLYRANVTDVLTGYFAWKKSALDSLYPHLTSNGFAIETEMITRMAHLGHQMASVPISYHPRIGTSNLRPVRDGLRISHVLFKNLFWYPAAQSSATAQHVQPAPRKIVFVSDAIYPYMKGGKEKRLHEISKRLVSMGHEVHIYTMHWWEDPTKVRIEKGVHLHAICKWYPMYRGHRRDIKEGIMFGLACFKLLRVSFDVLDVDHMPFFPILSSWFVCKLRRRKLYGTWHEALSRQEWKNYMGRSGYIASWIECLSIRLPHSITAASASTKELLASLHGRAERVWSVASGIDTELINRVEASSTQCDVLFAGRLVKDKHVDQLIAAIAIVVKNNPTVSCDIVGQGLEKERLMRQVEHCGLQKNITFHEPFPEAADLYASMKAAKVFCLPSVREGFGIVALEALACGTPVITTNSVSNAARHLIQEAENGSVVPLTAAALAEAIIYWTSLTQKPDTASPVASYDWHKLAEQQMKVYGGLT